jgi:hypothetical protein
MTASSGGTPQSSSARFASIFFGVSGVVGLTSAVSQIIDFIESGKYTALAWTAASLVLFAACVAAVAWRRGVGRLLEHLSGSQERRHWLLPACAVLVIALAVLWAGLVAVGAAGNPWTANEERSPLTASSPSPDQPPGLPWRDSFDDSRLDPEKWRPSPLPDVIFVRDGKLRFVVALAEDAEPISREVLEPIPFGRPISRIDATIMVEELGGPRRGGVIMFVRQELGTITGIAFGPSEDGPVVEPWLCPADNCSGDYGGFAHPSNKIVRFGSGQELDVHVQQTGERVEVQVGGISFSSRDDPSPVASIIFRLDADPGDQWSATVDDLVLTPFTR